MALQRQLRQTSQPNLLNKISRFWLKGPAFAGLFFVLSAGTGGFPPGASRLSAAGQQYFRAFIDVFTPLIYVAKSGRSARWGRDFLTQAASFIPPDRKVQLILDALDFPASLLETADATPPSWGVQLFGGAQVFGNAENATLFAGAVERMLQ